MLASLSATGICCAAILAGVFSPTAARHGYAAAATPPPPPTFRPTPIGPPPPPPTRTPTAGPTATPTTSTTAQPTATGTATVVVQRNVAFTLDAARVSTVNNPGNQEGLSSVKPGSRVWLMMYYTVTDLRKAVVRVTTYSVTSRGHTVFSVSYRSREKAGATGRFSRYTVYDVPVNLPYGTYFYHATLKLGSHAHRTTWRFKLGNKERIASWTKGQQHYQRPGR